MVAEFNIKQIRITHNISVLLDAIGNEKRIIRFEAFNALQNLYKNGRITGDEWNKIMITHTETDILSQKTDAIVSTANCVGIMGKGVAKSIKEKYPWCYQPYKDACRKGILKPGGIFTTTLKTYPEIEYPTIIHVATKDHWRGKSKLEWVEIGITNLSNYLRNYKITSMAIPRLGCGLGGLEWEDVKPLLYLHLENINCRITIHNKQENN